MLQLGEHEVRDFFGDGTSRRELGTGNGEQSLKAVAGVIADLLAPLERHARTLDLRGHDSVMDERHVGEREVQRGE